MEDARRCTANSFLKHLFHALRRECPTPGLNAKSDRTMQLCSLFELPSDVLLHSLSFLPLPDLAALRCTSQRGQRLALRAAASPMWRARRGHASALRLEMWRRGACDKRALEGGAYGRAHRHGTLARCCALTAAAADTTAGPLLASADDSGAVVVWETQRMLAGVATLRHGRPVRSLALDGQSWGISDLV